MDDTVQLLKQLELRIALVRARHDVFFHTILEMKAIGDLMSALSDKIAAANTSVDSALARVQEDVTTLNAKIAELEAKVKENPTPEDLAALDVLREKVDALDPVSPTTLPTP